MNVLQYVGARYVPKLFKADDGSMEWQESTYYEPLTLVTYNGTSYISRVPVPASVGIPVDYPDYWAPNGIESAYVKSLEEKLSQYVGTSYIMPESYGAVGNGVIDDTAAVQEAINTAMREGRPILLASTYYIAGALTISGSSIAMYGSHGGVPSTVTGVSPNTVFNLIFGPSGSMDIIGVGNCVFIGIGVRGGTINLSSFRNTFLCCCFDDMVEAIVIKAGTNWNGENKVLYCNFHQVSNCITALDGSDGDIIGNLADATCGNFLAGGMFSGYKIMQNHDYGRGFWDVRGSFYIIQGNYFDGFEKLQVTTVTGAIIQNNMFTGSAEGKSWVIKFLGSTVGNVFLNGNSVVNGDASMVFLDVSALQFFTANLTGCNVKPLSMFNRGTCNVNGTILPVMESSVLSVNSAVTIDSFQSKINGNMGIMEAHVSLNSVGNARAVKFSAAYSIGIAMVKLNNSEQWYFKEVTDGNFDFVGIGNYAAATSAIIYLLTPTA